MWYSGVGAFHSLIRGMMVSDRTGANSPGLGTMGLLFRTLEDEPFSCGELFTEKLTLPLSFVLFGEKVNNAGICRKQYTTTTLMNTKKYSVTGGPRFGRGAAAASFLAFLMEFKLKLACSASIGDGFAGCRVNAFCCRRSRLIVLVLLQR